MIFFIDYFIIPWQSTRLFPLLFTFIIQHVNVTRLVSCFWRIFVAVLQRHIQPRHGYCSILSHVHKNIQKDTFKNKCKYILGKTYPVDQTLRSPISPSPPEIKPVSSQWKSLLLMVYNQQLTSFWKEPILLWTEAFLCISPIINSCWNKYRNTGVQLFLINRPFCCTTC